MVVTLAAFKGGVSKTTSAIHLAAYLAGKGKTLLADGDPNHSASSWAQRGSLPFDVLPAEEAIRRSGEYAHLVLDTEARPSHEELLELAEGCDLLILPTTPDALSLDALMLTLEGLKGNYRILLAITPPKPSKAADDMRAELKGAGWPVFNHGVRRLAAFQKAAMLGCLVQDVPDPRAHLGWQDYQTIGKEVMKWVNSRG